MTLAVFFPPTMIMLLNQAPLFLHVEASESRLFLSASALLSTVMYHISIMGSIPDTASQNTQADSFMVLCYSINAMIWVAVLIQYIAHFTNRRPIVSAWVRVSFWYKTRLCGPPTSFLLSVLTFPSGSPPTSFLSPDLAPTVFFVVAVVGMVLFAVDFIAFYVKYHEKQRLSSTLLEGVWKRDHKEDKLLSCRCGTVFFDDSLFCHNCGAARKNSCSCGHLKHFDSKFCRKCGKSQAEEVELNDSASSANAERGQSQQMTCEMAVSG